jgi:hypothetical protein
MQASDDVEGLRLFVETAVANALPDDYEATVMVGFMCGIYEQYERQREATQKWYDEAHEKRRLLHATETKIAAQNLELGELKEQFHALEEAAQMVDQCDEGAGDGPCGHCLERLARVLNSNPASGPRTTVGGPSSRSLDGND